MKTVLYPLQVSIFQRLKSYTPLTSRVSGIYDTSLKKTFPYITLGEDTSVPWSTKSNPGEEVTHTLHVWSRYNGSKEVKELMSLIVEAITKGPLEIEGGFFVEFDAIDMMEVIADPDGQTRHGVIRLRFKIKQ